MSLEITSVAMGAARPVDRPQMVQPTAAAEPQPKQVDIEAAIRELDLVSQSFNKRLQYSINTKLNQVVVKVIDQQTEKVIKEIPPRELQIVHERIREALGLLFDERI